MDGDENKTSYQKALAEYTEYVRRQKQRDEFLEQIKQGVMQTRKGDTMARNNFARRFRTNRVLTHPNRPGEWIALVHTPQPGEWLTVDYTGDTRVVMSEQLARDWSAIQYMSQSILNRMSDPNFTQRARVTMTVWDSRYNLKVQSKIARTILGPANSVQSTGVTATAPTASTVASFPSASGPVILSHETDEIVFDEPIREEPKARVQNKGFQVPTINPDAYWYESKDDENLYRDFIALRKAGHTVNLLIAGPSGSGKTVGIQRLGKELGVPVHIINCQAITTPEKWLGQMHADPATGTTFVPSQHIEWVERTHPDCQGAERCIILYDEITRLRPELNNMTYSLFDTQRGLEVPQMGRRVVMADENIIVATANLGAAFTGTHTQDRAFRERFPLTMERDFPPKDEEQKIIGSATGINNAQAKQLVAIADHSRTLWRNGDIDSPISTRTLVNWALLVSGGYSVKKAAEYTVLPMFSDDGGAASDRAKITSTIEGKVKA